MKDGIPAIDTPSFFSVADVGFLGDREPVVSIELNGDVRAYPLQILTWHEIVNDNIGGQPVVVTFCPLCNTALALESVLDGQVLDFGVSGFLRNSDLIMYDRQTETWWQQVTGEGIVGSLTGTKLTSVPAQIVAWQDFRDNFPEGQVLSLPSPASIVLTATTRTPATMTSIPRRSCLAVRAMAGSPRWSGS